MTEKRSAPGFERREFLRSAGTAAGGVALLGGVSGGTPTADPTGSVTFEDQTSDGRTVVVAEVTTEVDAHLSIFDDDPPPIGGGIHLLFEGGETAEDVTVVLEEPLEETTSLLAQLNDRETGQSIDREEATVTVDDVPERIDGMEPTLIEADPGAGFNYPYYLYAPVFDADDDPRPILVEPTNTGSTSDDFDTHLDAGEETIERGDGRAIADRLPAPLVVPVFPRPSREPVDGTHYVHALDDTTMGIEDGDLERVDLQLLAMVEDAHARLVGREYPVGDGIVLNGFSASGNFVDRFAALHPDEVASVTAGGLNGMPLLPVEEASGHRLPFHVGVADLEELTGEPFDEAAFREVDRFLYMGELDRVDTIPGTGSFTDPELRETALTVFGPDPITDRFPYARAVYEDADVPAVFRLYDDAGHVSHPALDDLVEFHGRSLAGEDIADLQTDLGGGVPNLHAHVEYEPREPNEGQQVAFDATRSTVRGRDLVAFEWEFDGETKTGELVTHTFEAQGGHNVRLTVTDDEDETYEATEQVVVVDPSDAEPGPDDDDPSEDADPTDDGDADSITEDVPGFGVVGTVASLGTAGYLLGKRLGDEKTND